MSAFTLLRTKSSSVFVADAAPNTTPPAAGLTMGFDGPGGGHPGVGAQFHAAFFIAATGARVAAGDWTAKVWLKDPTSGRWLDFITITGIVSEIPVVSAQLLRGEVFVQVTAVTNPATATEIRVYGRAI